MYRKLIVFALSLLILILLTLAACGTQPGTSPTPEVILMVLGTPELISEQQIPGAALNQEQNNPDAEIAATAEIERLNAQATLDSANATFSAALTQEQNNADILAAQAAATAKIVRANAQATLLSAASTQSAALTQDTIRQTQVQEQRNKDEIAASTETAVANIITSQTQFAVATSQQYADQARQREQQMQGTVTFLWMLCLPVFILLLAGLILWAFWRWVKIQQGPRILENPVEMLPAPEAEVIVHPQDDSLQYLDSDSVDHRPQLTTPDDQVGRWLDEVKTELLNNDEKDKDANPGN